MLKSAALVVAVCLLLTFASCPSALAQSSATARRLVTSTFFGLSVVDLGNPNRVWPVSIQVGTLGKTQGTEWLDVEPANGTYNWAPLDNSIAAARAEEASPRMSDTSR